MKKIKRKKKINLVNDINSENVDDTAEWTGINNTLQKQGSTNSLDTQSERISTKDNDTDNEQIRIDLTKGNFVGAVKDTEPVVAKDVKIVIPEEEKKDNNTLTKNVGYLFALLQMIPSSNMVCKICIATGFTVMVMLNAEWLTLRWGFNFR